MDREKRIKKDEAYKAKFMKKYTKLFAKEMNGNDNTIIFLSVAKKDIKKFADYNEDVIFDMAKENNYCLMASVESDYYFLYEFTLWKVNKPKIITCMNGRED